MDEFLYCSHALLSKTNIMKKIYCLVVAAFLFNACGGSTTVVKEPVEQTEAKTEREKNTVAAHDLEKQKETKNLPKATPVEKSDKKTKWTRSGDPIDTKEFDTAIANAEKELKSAAGDSAKKNALAEAYFKRGFALTQARQYAAAIGDYRKALKQVPDHSESKKWIATISNIYKTMNREIPAEGEEPKPLAFVKN